MKNQNEMETLKRKRISSDDLLKLRGGAGPVGGGCASGEQEYNCTLVSCEGCSSTEGLVCATSSTAAEDAMWDQNPNAESISCTANNPS